MVQGVKDPQDKRLRQLQDELHYPVIDVAPAAARVERA